MVLYIRELGIGIVAYSPIGRGFLSSGPKMMEKLEDGDARKVCWFHFSLFSIIIMLPPSNKKKCSEIKWTDCQLQNHHENFGLMVLSEALQPLGCEFSLVKKEGASLFVVSEKVVL